MRRLLVTLAAVTAAGSGILTAATPAQAAQPALRFHGAQYDSPGKDNRSAASLNAEWISLVNDGTTAVNLTGWTIADQFHTYTFGNVSIPGKGGRIWLHTGKGANTKTSLYWNSGNYIWNNTGDAATLKNKAGAKHDTCSWTNKTGRAWVAC